MSSEKITSFLKKNWKILAFVVAGIFLLFLAWKLVLLLFPCLVAEGTNRIPPSPPAEKELQQAQQQEEQRLKETLSEEKQAKELTKEAGPAVSHPTKPSTTDPEDSSPRKPLENADLQKLVKIGDTDTEKES